MNDPAPRVFGNLRHRNVSAAQSRRKSTPSKGEDAWAIGGTRRRQGDAPKTTAAAKGASKDPGTGPFSEARPWGPETWPTPPWERDGIDETPPDNPHDDVAQAVMNELPAMPPVLNDLKEALKANGSSAQSIADVLESDTSLVAQILKVVNSAFFGLARPVIQVRAAVAYLGFEEIHRIAISTSALMRIAPDDANAMEQFWHRATHTATLSKALAATYEPMLDPADLWSLALLHDIGTLVRDRLYPEQAAEVREKSETDRIGHDLAEEQLNAVSHTRLGALLSDYWGLPAPVAEIARRHHAVTAPPAPGMRPAHRGQLRIVQAASALVEHASCDLNVDEERRQMFGVVHTLSMRTPDHPRWLLRARQIGVEIKQRENAEDV